MGGGVGGMDGGAEGMGGGAEGMVRHKQMARRTREDLDELRRVVCRGVERARRCRRRARGSVVVERDDARCDWHRQDARARWVAVSVDSRVSDVRAIVK